MWRGWGLRGAGSVNAAVWLAPRQRTLLRNAVQWKRPKYNEIYYSLGLNNVYRVKIRLLYYFTQSCACRDRSRIINVFFFIYLTSALSSFTVSAFVNSWKFGFWRKLVSFYLVFSCIFLFVDGNIGINMYQVIFL